MKHNQDTQPRSHLFTVRVWGEELTDDKREWRGKVQHVSSGEAFYFRHWSRLVEGLERWLEQDQDASTID